MSRVLIIFPHGLGDFIMATPSLKKFISLNPSKKVDLAVTSFAFGSGIYRCGLDFENIFCISRPWGKRGHLKGFDIIDLQVDFLCKIFNYEKVIKINHDHKNLHKVFDTALSLGVDLEDTSYLAAYTQQEKQQAKKILEDKGLLGERYIFLHKNTSDLSKDLTLTDLKAAGIIREKLPIFDVHKDMSIEDFGIGVAFFILSQAEKTILADSVFAHAADAFKKNIDVHITKSSHDLIVCPLNISRHKIIFKDTGTNIKRFNRFYNTYLHYRQRFSNFAQRLSSTFDFNDDFSAAKIQNHKLGPHEYVSIEVSKCYVRDGKFKYRDVNIILHNVDGSTCCCFLEDFPALALELFNKSVVSEVVDSLFKFVRESDQTLNIGYAIELQLNTVPNNFELSVSSKRRIKFRHFPNIDYFKGNYERYT